ncbi:MAG: hypothetical protein RLZZ164_172 [Actinomycetota bacterium]|jgi:hypothetical protein
MFKWGSVAAASLLLLTSCAAPPKPTASPSVTSHESANADDAVQNEFFSILDSSCAKALQTGLRYSMAADNLKQSDILIAPSIDIHHFFDPSNMISNFSGEWAAGGFGDGDVLCVDSSNHTSAMQPEVSKLPNGHFTLAMHRGGPDMVPYEYTVADGLVCQIDVSTLAGLSGEYKLSYGLKPDELKRIKTLNPAND